MDHNLIEAIAWVLGETEDDEPDGDMEPSSAAASARPIMTKNKTPAMTRLLLAPVCALGRLQQRRHARVCRRR